MADTASPALSAESKRQSSFFKDYPAPWRAVHAMDNWWNVQDARGFVLLYHLSQELAEYVASTRTTDALSVKAPTTMGSP